MRSGHEERPRGGARDNLGGEPAATVHGSFLAARWTLQEASPRHLLVEAVTALKDGGVAYGHDPRRQRGHQRLRRHEDGARARLRHERYVVPGCGSKEAALDWNQTGPQEPQGVTGTQGPAGTADAYVRISAAGVVNPTSRRT